MDSAIASSLRPDFEPGQAAADNPSKGGTQNVYIPDVSGTSPGIFRMLFTPDATGGTYHSDRLLNTGVGKVAAVALPSGPFNDGALYLGYLDQAQIKKITNPTTSPSTPFNIGATGNSVGVLSMAFNGNDLYMAEIGPPPKVSGQLILKGQVTVLVSASPALQRGNALPVTRALSRLQSPPSLGVLQPVSHHSWPLRRQAFVPASAGSETVAQRSCRSGHGAGALHGQHGREP